MISLQHVDGILDHTVDQLSRITIYTTPVYSLVDTTTFVTSTMKAGIALFTLLAVVNNRGLNYLCMCTVNKLALVAIYTNTGVCSYCYNLATEF